MLVKKFQAIYPQVRLINQTNSGYCQAMNRLIAQAKGDYVISLNSDDWLEEDILSLIDSSLSRYDDSDLLLGEWVVHEGENLILSVSRVASEGCVVLTNGNIYDALDRCILRTASNSGWVIRRSLAIKMTFEGNPCGADTRFMSVILSKANRIVLLNKPMLHAEKRGESLSHKRLPEGFDIDWISLCLALIPALRQSLHIRAGRIPELVGLDLFVHHSLSIMNWLRGQGPEIRRNGIALWAVSKLIPKSHRPNSLWMFFLCRMPLFSRFVYFITGKSAKACNRR